MTLRDKAMKAMWIFAWMVVVAIGVIFIVSDVSYHANSKQITNDELRIINGFVNSRLETATSKFESEGIEAAVKYCAEDRKLHTKAGEVKIVCTVCADFYNPQDKVIRKDNDIIFPISMYMHAIDGIEYLENGWKFRNLSVTAFAKRGDYGHIGKTAEKKYR